MTTDDVDDYDRVVEAELVKNVRKVDLSYGQLNISNWQERLNEKQHGTQEDSGVLHEPHE